MKKIVLGLVCAMSFSFATTSEDNQKNVDETLKKFYTKIEKLKQDLSETTLKEKKDKDKEIESHEEKYILHYCISLMQELVGCFEEWYRWVHGENAIEELSEEERFYYNMSYFHIVQELFLFRTYHSGGTSTMAKCRQLGVDSGDNIEFKFSEGEEDDR